MNFILPETSHDKSITELLGYLKGASEHSSDKEWVTTLKAFKFARKYHTGLRKDGKSPEFSHQVFQINYARALLPHLIHPAQTVSTIALHDVCEDYEVSFETIESQFGKVVRDGVEAMTKKYKGIVIPYDVYFDRLSKDPCGSIAKGIDRGHNILTMGDTDWSADKQEQYLVEINQHFLPMNKKASENFPEQGPLYENIKSLLLTQAKHIQRNLFMMRQLAGIQEAPDTTFKI
jgi:(p)ppGpp synthase/HD superfamily hydrolase